jgi:hypothetical protein
MLGTSIPSHLDSLLASGVVRPGEEFGATTEPAPRHAADTIDQGAENRVGYKFLWKGPIAKEKYC